MLMLAVLNSYIQYKEHCKAQDPPRKPMLHRTFQGKIAKALVASSAPLDPSIRGAASTAEDVQRLTGRHFPSRVQPKPGQKKKNPQRMCSVCCTSTGKRKHRSDGRKRKETVCECVQCGLCWKPCFRIYHTQRIINKHIITGRRDKLWKVTVTERIVYKYAAGTTSVL